MLFATDLLLATATWVWVKMGLKFFWGWVAGWVFQLKLLLSQPPTELAVNFAKYEYRRYSYSDCWTNRNIGYICSSQSDGIQILDIIVLCIMAIYKYRMYSLPEYWVFVFQYLSIHPYSSLPIQESLFLTWKYLNKHCGGKQSVSSKAVMA